MITKVSCSACGRDQNASSSRAGELVPCRFCGESIRVPGAKVQTYTSAIGGWEIKETPQPAWSGPSGAGQQPELVPELVEERRESISETTSTEWRTESSSFASSDTSLDSDSTRRQSHESVHSSFGPAGVYESSSRVEVSPEGEVRETRTEFGRAPGGEPFEASYESVAGPEEQFSESSHSRGSRAAGFEGGGDASAPSYDRTRQRGSAPRPVGSPIGTPITTSRHQREAKAGRPIVEGHPPGRTGNILDTFMPGLNSDSETEKAASIALVLAILGWAFCFPISLLSLYQVKQAKTHALAEGRPLPQLATVATVLALLNLGFMGLTCLGNVSL